jgi:hypothetical protein
MDWRISKMTTQACLKCGNVDTFLMEYKEIPFRTFSFCLLCHAQWTDWQQAEISRLRTVLREIAEHPHCKNGIDCLNFNRADSLTMSKSALVELGHRCAAEIARKGIA